MGDYINPGKRSFQMVLNSPIYVDKTMIIDYTNSVLNTENRFVCVSRPRRFGKTIALNTLAAYYGYGGNSAKLFAPYLASQTKDFSRYLNTFNVLKLNMIEFLTAGKNNVTAMLEELRQLVLFDLQEAYPECFLPQHCSLLRALRRLANYTGRQFVILIDEWDCVFRELEHDEAGQKLYLDFLRDLLKDQDFVALAYMTGILPIKKYGKHSALNMFSEFSMENAGRLAEYVGFTNEEVQQLAQTSSLSYALLKQWYDGYILGYTYEIVGQNTHIAQYKQYEIYNPLSVVSALNNCQCQNYWNKTETYEALKRYIMLNQAGLKDIIIKLLAGARVKIDSASFNNDMVNFGSADEVLTLLVHLGYLGYDGVHKEVFIPNNEIRDEFQTSIGNEDSWQTIADAIKLSDATLQSTWNLDADAVAQAVEKAHFETSSLQYNDENALSYVVSLAYYTARRIYKITREMPAGKGFADMLFRPLPNHLDKPPLLIELKYDESAETALQQIKERQYLEALKDYHGEALLVGISYSKDSQSKNYKKHHCVIEKIML